MADNRPEFDDYYMTLAQASAARANCRGLDVGAVIVKNHRVLATGYNGTPEGFDNCDEGGCTRCSNRSVKEGDGGFKSGEGYDLCICVHAESNAILSAAKHGIPLDGAVVYSTHQPCFSCSKELLQAGIVKCWYLNGFPAPEPPSNEPLWDHLKEHWADLQAKLESEQIENPIAVSQALAEAAQRANPKT